MRLSILLIAAILCSCGPSYHLKKARKHLNKAVEQGASVDSILHIKYDTIQVAEVMDSSFMELAIDTVRIIELCDSIRENPPKIIRNIHKEFTNEVHLDTTYRVSVIVQDSTYYYPVHLQINNSIDGFNYIIEMPKASISVRTESMSIQIQTKIPWWIWVIIGAMGVCIFILIIKK